MIKAKVLGVPSPTPRKPATSPRAKVVPAPAEVPDMTWALDGADNIDVLPSPSPALSQRGVSGVGAVGGMSNVQVFARFRPLNDREKALGRSVSEPIQLTDRTITINGTAAKTADGAPISFTFDRVFGPDSTQDEVFRVASASAIQDLFSGYHNTIFAYGQTGAGKSHTMMGDLSKETTKGLVPRCMHAMFDVMRSRAADKAVNNIEHTISCSYLQVYMEEICDLLRPEMVNLQIRESPTRGIYIDDLSTEYVTSEQNVFDLLALGEVNRRVSATKMNSQSSRSHSCFIVNVLQKDSEGASTSSRFNLVDLAGSERASKTGAQGQTLDEARKINQSLSCLSHCIHALSSGSAQHVPFRSSKLTRLLQQSLGGNCKTHVIVACSPHFTNLDETITTLRFGERCASIKCEVKANVTLSADQLELMVKSLTSQLEQLQANNLELNRALKGEVVTKEAETQCENSGMPVMALPPPPSDPAVAHVVSTVHLQGFPVSDFSESVQEIFRDAIVTTIRNKVPEISELTPSHVIILSVSEGLLIRFQVNVSPPLAIQVSTAIAFSTGFGSDTSLQKLLEESGINCSVELIGRSQPQWPQLSDGQSEIDRLYTAIIQKEAEIESLTSNLTMLEKKLDIAKEQSESQATAIDALNLRLFKLNQDLLDSKSNKPLENVLSNIHIFESANNPTRRSRKFSILKRPASTNFSAIFANANPDVAPTENFSRVRRATMQGRNETTMQKALDPQVRSPSMLSPSQPVPLEMVDEAIEAIHIHVPPPPPPKKLSLAIENIPVAVVTHAAEENVSEMEKLRAEVDELHEYAEELEFKVEEAHSVIARQAQSLERLEQSKHDVELDKIDFQIESQRKQKQISELESEIANLREKLRSQHAKDINVAAPVHQSVLNKNDPASSGLFSFSFVTQLFGSDEPEHEQPKPEAKKEGIFGLFG